MTYRLYTLNKIQANGVQTHRLAPPYLGELRRIETPCPQRVTRNVTSG